jgi:hypothetical protein
MKTSLLQEVTDNLGAITIRVTRDLSRGLTDPVNVDTRPCEISRTPLKIAADLLGSPVPTSSRSRSWRQNWMYV